MLTPRFSLSQDEDTVTVTIRAPYCSLRDLDVDADADMFLFHCKPYYLRLHLPGAISSECKKSSFDADLGEFEFCYNKEQSGEHFKDLELITKLLCPKVETGEQFDITLRQDAKFSEGFVLSSGHEYGFAMKCLYSFHRVIGEFAEVFKIDPREVALSERRKLRLADETKHFNREHYLCDYIEDEEISELVALEAPWGKPEKVKFTDDELDFLKDLSNKSFDLTSEQLSYALLGLLDILYSYCYDRRTTYFEGTVESGWTIVELCTTLSWLDGFESTKEAIVTTVRRSLIYPLYRNFDLSLKVLDDLKLLVEQDEIQLIKCLIEIYNIFLQGDCCRYILNDLFIKDYIIFIMKWNKEDWTKVIDQLKSLNVKKEDLGLNLVDVEKGDDLCNKLSKIKINSNDSDDSSSESSSDSGNTETDDLETDSEDSETDSLNSDDSETGLENSTTKLQ